MATNTHIGVIAACSRLKRIAEAEAFVNGRAVSEKHHCWPGHGSWGLADREAYSSE